MLQPKGCLIFAHDGDGSMDYGSQAVLAAELVVKHLGVPVSLVADNVTISNVLNKFKKLPFDQLIPVDMPVTNNKRFLTDHVAIDLKNRLAYFKEMIDLDSMPQSAQEHFNVLEKFILENAPTKETITFHNDTRVLAYEVTPYIRTLVIDSDFLIFSDQLNKYWDLDYDFMITPGMLELQQNTIGPTDYQINPYSINMLWATNIMFTRNDNVKIFFDLLKYIKEEYWNYFANLYDFNSNQFRNDFAFSIACHIMSSHGAGQWHGELPVPLIFADSDVIIDVKDNGQLTFLLGDKDRPNDYLLAKSHNQDVHILNKRNILANLDKLRKLANE